MQELNRPRILVAEDNTPTQIVILGYLELLGFQVEAVANGEEAVKSFSGGSFDLILMDCQMPLVDGYEATRRIRALEQSAGLSHIPILAITGAALGDETEVCRKAGMDACISKPVRALDFERTLTHWLSRESEKSTDPSKHQKPSGDPSIEPTVDERFLDSLEVLQLEGEPDIIVELINYFQAAGPQKVKNILSSARKGDLKKVRSDSHAFKSTCHNLGAKRLAFLCEQIEDRAAKETSTASIQELVRSLEIEFSAASTELEAFRLRRNRRAS